VRCNDRPAPVGAPSTPGGGEWLYGLTKQGTFLPDGVAVTAGGWVLLGFCGAPAGQLEPASEGAAAGESAPADVESESPAGHQWVSALHLHSGVVSSVRAIARGGGQLAAVWVEVGAMKFMEHDVEDRTGAGGTSSVDVTVRASLLGPGCMRGVWHACPDITLDVYDQRALLKVADVLAQPGRTTAPEGVSPALAATAPATATGSATASSTCTTGSCPAAPGSSESGCATPLVSTRGLTRLDGAPPLPPPLAAGVEAIKRAVCKVNFRLECRRRFADK
jgi:hypothetical protein